MTPNDQPRRFEPGPETPGPEILVTRILDGEAGEDDRARFELLAAGDPRLWRLLALSQQDALELRDQVDATIAPGLEVELPGTVPTPRSHRAGALRAVGGSLGWAAAVLLGLGWLIASSLGPSSAPSRGTVANDATAIVPLSPEEHLREYLEAPNILGELEPVLLEAEGMSDGRVAVRYVRRIEEFTFIEPGERFSVKDLTSEAARDRVEPSPRSD